MRVEGISRVQVHLGEGRGAVAWPAPRLGGFVASQQSRHPIPQPPQWAIAVELEPRESNYKRHCGTPC